MGPLDEYNVHTLRGYDSTQIFKWVPMQPQTITDEWTDELYVTGRIKKKNIVFFGAILILSTRDYVKFDYNFYPSPDWKQTGQKSLYSYMYKP